jgi:hypothetical protein
MAELMVAIALFASISVDRSIVSIFKAWVLALIGA